MPGMGVCVCEEVVSLTRAVEQGADCLYVTRFDPPKNITSKARTIIDLFGENVFSVAVQVDEDLGGSKFHGGRSKRGADKEEDEPVTFAFAFG